MQYKKIPGGWFNIQMPSYQYRKSHMEYCTLPSSVASTIFMALIEWYSCFWLMTVTGSTGILAVVHWFPFIDDPRPTIYQRPCVAGDNALTDWGLNKVGQTLQMTFSSAFSWMKINVVWFWYHWSFVSKFPLYIASSPHNKAVWGHPFGIFDLTFVIKTWYVTINQVPF